MIKKLFTMALLGLCLCVWTAQAYPPAPASQAQVNTGTEPYLYVTPLTLQNKTGGSGGNTFIVTNNTVGSVQAFAGGITNAPVGPANAFTIFSEDGSSSLTTEAQPGTYTNFTVAFAGVGAGTNYTIMVRTNRVPTAMVLTVTGNTGAIDSSHSFSVGLFTSIDIMVSNNAATPLTPGAITWTLGMQVPTSVQSVSSTVTNVNPAIATNSIIGAPDFSKPYGLLTTNQSFILSNPIHDVAGVVNQTVSYITNTSGSVINITAPPAWGNHTNQGPWNCTNEAVITVVDYAQGFTNAILSPLW